MKNNPRYNPIFKFDIGFFDESLSERKQVEDRFIIMDNTLANFSLPLLLLLVLIIKKLLKWIGLY